MLVVLLVRLVVLMIQGVLTVATQYFLQLLQLVVEEAVPSSEMVTLAVQVVALVNLLVMLVVLELLIKVMLAVRQLVAQVLVAQVAVVLMP